ncbi:MAG: adenylate/guanylate cyclase domain-containing protein [Actinomycetota bacterium]
MAALVSLVMTDIVGSTRRWNMAEGAMAADMETHDRLIVEVVAAAGGRVFKHTGDGMIAVFDDPAAAVSAAAGVQRALGDIVWQHADGLQVRAAVHSGVVYERDGDMFGTAVNKVARILSVCPPGAVLVSNTIAVLLAERAPEGHSLRVVGEVSLTGFSTPEVVHAVTGAGVAVVGSLSAAIDPGRRGGELPRIDDELLGRTDEVAAIWDALGRARLVTLVGVGGMGKTRLALEVAAGGSDAFAGGVWWIDLSNATTADAVVPVALAAVGARETEGRTALQAVCDRFAGMTALVVIDNCEHVLHAAFELVDALRSAAPELRIVATSREALGVRGEQLIPIGSLPIADGVALFAERARAVRPDLDVDANREVIERLCARLDGIPLAIELAAARCRSMLPAEIDSRLDDRFRLLRGGRAGAERHRTLQAAVAWSYEMLDDDERTVFQGLCVFAGGTLVDGLAVVCGIDELEVLDIVDRLIARSMVVTVACEFGSRYELLETLRQFAEDRLVEAGTIDQVRNRHLDWVHHLAGSIARSGGTPGAGHAFCRFCVEVDNMRVAIAHALGTDRHHRAHEIVAAIGGSALIRLEYSLFDMVRPIRLDDDWTDAAAVCAAWGAHADQQRGVRPVEGPVGGVPEHFVRTNPAVTLLHAWLQLVGFGRWQVALDLIEGIRPSGDGLRLAVDQAWLAFTGLAINNDRHEVDLDEVDRRGRAALALARSTGDEVAIAEISIWFASALAWGRPQQALDLTADAKEIALRLGALQILDVATAFAVMALASGLANGTVERRAVAFDLRQLLVNQLQQGSVYNVVVLSGVVFTLFATHDPDAAIMLVLAIKDFNGFDYSLTLHEAGVDLPADLTPYRTRLAAMSLADVVGQVIAALDRVIAEEEADTAAGGGS